MVSGSPFELLSVITGQSVGDGSLLHVLAFSLGTLLGIYALWNGSTNLWYGYRLWSTAPTSVATARDHDGDVGIRGTAEVLTESLSGRFSALPCLLQEWEKTRASAGAGDVGVQYQPLDEGREGIPFLVRDDSGTIAVDPSEATLSIEPDRDNTSHGVRQVEARLKPGDDVHVYGQICRAANGRDDLGGESVYVGAGEDLSTFHITDSEPDETVLRLIGAGTLYTIAGVLVTVVFGVATMAALGV